jgi:hypothetical protein
MPLSLRSLVNNWPLYRYDGRPRAQVNAVASFSVSKIVPIPMFKAIAVQFRFLPYSDISRSFYESTFLFYDITYQDEQDIDHDLGIEIVPGTVKYIQRPSYSQSPCAVACMCLDFAYSWALSLEQRGSGAANISYYVSHNYVRKTPNPPLGRPFRNPLAVPSICKHLLRSSRALSQRNFLRP